MGNAVSLVPRGAWGLAAVAGLVACVTGCATKGVSYATPATAAPAATAPASAAPTGPMTPVPQASGQLTGTQLAQVLLPQSDFPAGFSLSSSSVVSSGDALSPSPATYNLASVSCADFVNHLGNTGFGETSMAANSYVGTQQAFDQVVYQFGSAAAASAFVDGIRSVAARCASFTATDNGAKGTFSLKASAGAAVGGHPSLDLLQTGTISRSSLTLDAVFSASGVDVFAGAAVGLGTATPAGLAKETIVYDLMKRQAAAAVLG
jgi:hypothetical protein